MSDEYDEQAEKLCCWHDGDGWRDCHQDVLAAVASALRNLAKERDHARSQLRAYIANVEEMALGAHLPDMFLVQGPDLKQWAVPPEKAESFYRAIKNKWKADEASLVRMYDEQYSRMVRAEAERDNWRKAYMEIAKP